MFTVDVKQHNNNNKCFLSLLLLYTTSSNLSSHQGGRDPLWWTTLFPVTFLPKYLTGCFSFFVVGGNHGIGVQVLILHSSEWFKFPTYPCLRSACQIWPLSFSNQILVSPGLAFSPSLDELERSSSPSHDQSVPLSAPGKLLVIWMLS